MNKYTPGIDPSHINLKLFPNSSSIYFYVIDDKNSLIKIPIYLIFNNINEEKNIWVCDV